MLNPVMALEYLEIKITRKKNNKLFGVILRYLRVCLTNKCKALNMSKLSR